MSIDDLTLLGLTKKGLDLYQAIWATTMELAIPAKHPKTKEPGFETSTSAMRAIRRRVDDLWTRAGLGRSIAREDTLMSLADGPRTLPEIVSERTEEVDAKSVRRAIPELLRAALITDDKDEMWVRR